MQALFSFMRVACWIPSYSRWMDLLALAVLSSASFIVAVVVFLLPQTWFKSKKTFTKAAILVIEITFVGIIRSIASLTICDSRQVFQGRGYLTQDYSFLCADADGKTVQYKHLVNVCWSTIAFYCLSNPKNQQMIFSTQMLKSFASTACGSPRALESSTMGASTNLLSG